MYLVSVQEEFNGLPLRPHEIVDHGSVNILNTERPVPNMEGLPDIGSLHEDLIVVFLRGGVTESDVIRIVASHGRLKDIELSIPSLEKT